MFDNFKKQIMRAFRSHLKNQFNVIYSHKQYYWIDASRRSSAMKFFRDGYNIPEKMYKDYEGVFLKLIFHNLSDS